MIETGKEIAKGSLFNFVKSEKFSHCIRHQQSLLWERASNVEVRVGGMRPRSVLWGAVRIFKSLQKRIPRTGFSGARHSAGRGMKNGAFNWPPWQ